MPDGLIVALDGPYEGKANDATMVEENGLAGRIEGIFEGERVMDLLFLFGDAAYTCNRTILSPYPEPYTVGQAAFNASLQEPRLAVDGAFSWVVGRFTANHLKHNLKLGLQPLGPTWQVSVLLANCLTCMKEEGN